jgi:tetratricopeptide (TPR) repeat protein
MKSIKIIILAAIPVLGFSQKNKVQTAWRALNDYESTLKDSKDGTGDIVYLNKANEAIDAALANDETKAQAKTHAYKARIAYTMYQYSLNKELKKLEATVGDKTERMSLAYGNTDLRNFEIANNEVNWIKENDPKYFETIRDYLMNNYGGRTGSDDDLKFVLVVDQVKKESANIANGKYKAKMFDEAADYFYKAAYQNMAVTGKKDTANFYNACVSAAKAKNAAKILEYNKKMVDLKIASSYNFEAMYNANLAKGDTTAAMSILTKGRQALPNDMSLMNIETNYFLSKGKQQEALNNLKASIDKDPKNALFQLVIGNIYDNMANPKDKTTGKDGEKPANFDELFKNAEASYQKAIDLSGANKEIAYNSNYNMGAMYNNYGGYLQNKKADAKITDLTKQKKEIADNEAKSQEYYKKAIPYLEKALEMKPDDKSTMVALRKLYMLTGNQAKATEMNDKIKGGK